MSEKLNRERLEEIAARAEAATEGPWGAYKYYIGNPDGMVVPDLGTWDEGDGMKWQDKEFIAHAREDVPALLSHITALEAEVERLRAVVDAARWVTPYIPEVGEETYCHPMHHGYHDGQFHTVYITTREQEQFGKWAEDFVDALAALQSLIRPSLDPRSGRVLAMREAGRSAWMFISGTGWTRQS